MVASNVDDEMFCGLCDECGMPYWRDVNGTNHHTGPGMDEIDHDADDDHVPYSVEDDGCLPD